MQVGVVIDVQVTAPTDDEGVGGGDPIDLAGEVQDELVGCSGLTSGVSVQVRSLMNSPSTTPAPSRNGLQRNGRTTIT